MVIPPVLANSETPNPLAGAPLITPDLIVIYFIFFILILGLADLIIHFIRRPKNLKERLKILLILGILIKLLVIGGGSALAAYVFLPAPKVIYTSPSVMAEGVGNQTKIEIQFDRPVSRNDLI